VNSTSGADASTPLMHAVKGSSAPRSAATVELLLDAGADVNIKNRFGSLALHMATWRGASLETIRLLLKRGSPAHVNVTNEFGHTPARIAAEKGRSDVAALFASVGEQQG